MPHLGELAIQTEPLFTPVTFIGAWINFGGLFNPAGYLKDQFGIVRLRGLVKSGVFGTPIFNLPAGFRPVNTELFGMLSNGAIIELDIQSNGNVTPITGSTYVALDGITFRAGA